MPATAPDTLSATFSALADPTRRAILARLADGPATVKELAAPFRMSGPAVSKHLRVLERAGLIQQGREAQSRPRTLDAAPLREVTEWAVGFRRFWDASLARLDDYLQTLTDEDPSDAPHPGSRRQPVRHPKRPGDLHRPRGGRGPKPRLRRVD